MIEKLSQAMHLRANKKLSDEQYYREAQELKRQMLVACQKDQSIRRSNADKPSLWQKPRSFTTGLMIVE